MNTIETSVYNNNAHWGNTDEQHVPKPHTWNGGQNGIFVRPEVDEAISRSLSDPLGDPSGAKASDHIARIKSESGIGIYAIIKDCHPVTAMKILADRILKVVDSRNHIERDVRHAFSIYEEPDWEEFGRTTAHSDYEALVELYVRHTGRSEYLAPHEVVVAELGVLARTVPHRYPLVTQFWGHFQIAPTSMAIRIHFLLGILFHGPRTHEEMTAPGTPAGRATRDSYMKFVMRELDRVVEESKRNPK